MLSRIFKKFKSFIDGTYKEKKLRENAQRNFEMKDKSSQAPHDYNAKAQSMIDSQGTSSFSGSGHNAPGKADSSKKTFNRSHHDFHRI